MEYQESENNLQFNFELAEILGAFIGDGWIENRGTALYITGNRTEDKEYYDDFLGPLFSKHFVKVIPREFPYWQVYGITTYKRKAIFKALELGFQKGKKSNVAKIPDEIMESNKLELITAVLRGLFDTDGSFYCKKSYGKYDTSWRKENHTVPRIIFSTVSVTLKA